MSMEASPHSEHAAHMEKLRNLCRLCGTQIKGNKYLCKTLANIIAEVYNVNIVNDLADIHPEYLCGPCRCKMNRKTEGDFLKPYCFEERKFTGCMICNVHRGRPNKRKSACISRSDKADAQSSNDDIAFEKRPCSRHDESLSLDRINKCEKSSCSRSVSSDPVNSDKYKKSSPSTTSTCNMSNTACKDISVEMDDVSFEKVEVTGTPVELYEQTHLAEILKCSICLTVLKEPVYTVCQHIFCKSCIVAWCTVRQSCPVCRGCIDVEQDLLPLPNQLLVLFDTLTLKKNERGKSPGHFVENKVPLYSVSRKYAKQYRLRSVISDVGKFCETHKENQTDVLFFMLRQRLEDLNDKSGEAIDSLWAEHFGSLSIDECLALRVDTLQSKSHYRSQYQYLKQKGCLTFCTPHAVNNAEKNYLPQSVRFSVQANFFGHGDLYHTPLKPKEIALSHEVTNDFKPINVTSCLSSPELPFPNLKGVRYNYVEAIAKTLEELDPYIKDGLVSNKIDPSDPSLLLKTYIKDGADGMGEVSVYWEKSDCSLPDKAFRFAFAVVKVTRVASDGVEIVIFEEEKPNSIRTNRPLLEAIADENHRSSSVFCMAPIETERSFLKDKILKVHMADGCRRHELKFYTSMIDEKFDRAESGLGGSGSRYLCTLCTATREKAKSALGTFSITRTFAETKSVAEYIKVNPDKLSQTQLDKLSYGVKSVPILTADAIEKGIDATHSDINMALFFKKVILREIAGVSVWELNQDIKPLICEAETKFDKVMRSTTGIHPALMMPGNYARIMFDEKNEKHVTCLITCQVRRSLMNELLSLFRKLRKIYRSRSPKVDYPDEVKAYKKVAVSMGQFLLQNYSYIEWPNYLHKIIEHVQELIESVDGPGCIGSFSGEGNEGGIKVFRFFRKNLSRKGDVIWGLQDVL